MTKSVRMRVWAAAVALIVVLSLLGSALYMALEADHDCPGDDCLICARIAVCLRNFTTLGVTLTVTAAGLTALRHVQSGDPVRTAPRAATPVTLRVKLSN